MIKHRLAVCDVDDTLLPKAAPNIPSATVRAMLAARAHGVRFAIASGRSPASITDLLQRSCADVSGDLVRGTVIIAFNGALAMRDGAILYSEFVDQEVAGDIVRMCSADNALNAAFFSLQGCTMLRDGPWTTLYGRKQGIPITVGDPVHSLDRLLKVLVLSPADDVERMQRIDTVCRTSRASTFRAVTQWANTTTPAAWLEVMAPGVNKALAVRRLSQLLPARLDEIVCFGDGINDLEMLQIPEVFSVVVGPSPYPEVIASADCVANACDADPPGVAQILYQMLGWTTGAP